MKKNPEKDSNLSSELSPGTGNADEVRTLGDRIRFVWILSGLKRDELAERLGVTSATLTNYASNKRSPTSGFLVRLCTEFNVSPSWLLLVREPMFLDYQPDHPDLSPPNNDQLDPQVNCPRCKLQDAELREERKLNRELVAENRQLNAENRTLLKENGELRVELERAKARAAPDQEPPEDARNCA